MKKVLLAALFTLGFVTVSASEVIAQTSADTTANIENSVEATAVDFSKYDYVDPGNIVPEIPLRRALAYYDVYYNKIANKNYVTVVDFTKHNSQKRMFLIDMKTGRVSTYLVAHGKGSDPSHTGYAKKLSNTPGSSMSSSGLYVTGAQYTGSHGKSLRMHGLESTNSNALSRAIVIHGAWYVDPKYNPIGRSNGCPAVENRYISSIVDRLKGGSVYYIWSGR